MNQPVQATDSAPLWEGFERGELQLPFCGTCGRPHLPAGPICPYCWSTELHWRSASLRAILSTWVVERKKYFAAFDPPYIVAEVQLEDGPRLPVHIAFEHLDRLRIDLPGTLAFERAGNGLTLPRFEPDAQ